MNMKTIRVLSAYDKATEKLVQEIELPIGLDALRKILGEDASDPDLYDAYPINSVQFNTIANLVPEVAKVSFNEFDFFYECFAL